MRNLGLDILRLVAVVLVLGRHLYLPKEESPFLKVWQTGGWVGVDLFFVLSGYLVSGLLFREFQRHGTVDLKRFLIRRGFKIYPAFYAMILTTLAVAFVTGEGLRWNRVAGELLFLQNYLGGLWHHTWSLAVEEHFYLWIAFLCFFALRRDRLQVGPGNPFRLVPRLFLLTASACLLLRIATLFVFESYSHRAYLFGTHIRIDSLMYGVLLSYGSHFHQLESRLAKVNTPSLLTAGCLSLCPAFLFPLEIYKAISVFGVILFYLGSGLLVLVALRLRGTRNPLLGVLGTLGASSYSIYLWHLPVLIWGWPLFQKIPGCDGYLAFFCFYMLGSLVFGWLMSKAVEWPMLKLRERLFPSEPAPPATGLPPGVPTPKAPPAV